MDGEQLQSGLLLPGASDDSIPLPPPDSYVLHVLPRQPRVEQSHHISEPRASGAALWIDRHLIFDHFSRICLLQRLLVLLEVSWKQ